MDVFFLHFSAHVGSSYFLCDQIHSLLSRSRLSFFASLAISVLIAFFIGVAYKCVESYMAGQLVPMFQSITYNCTGILLAVNKILADNKKLK